jgi:hypothetical protein
MKLAERAWVVASAWLVSRAVLLLVWLPAVPELAGDVHYYWRNTAALASGTASPASLMVEYPTPVLWLLRVPLLLGGGTEEGFRLAFHVIMVALDLAFTLVLWRRGRGWLATWFWVVFVLAMGPIVYQRLDLLPAVLSATALLALGARRYAGVGVALAAGAGLKFWPAFLLPATLRGERRSDAITAAVFAGGGVLIVAGSVAYAGFARLVSPLAWQSGRGLQIESIWATPLMIARIFDPQAHPVRYSTWQAYEVFGQGVDALLVAANVSTMLSYLAFVVGYGFWLRRLYLRRQQPSVADAALLTVTVVAVLLIANKTLSPQYLLWLGAPVAVLLLHQPSSRPLGAGVLLLGVLTEVVYPALYAPLLAGGTGSALAVVVLALRNLGLVAVAGWLVARSVRLLASADK